MIISNDVTIQNSMSSAQCIAKCRSNVKCCAASYSEATMACHLDISGTCNAVKTSASEWITMTKDNFGEYNNYWAEEVVEDNCNLEIILIELKTIPIPKW